MLFGSGQGNEEWVFFCLGSVVCLKLAACLANLRNKVRHIKCLTWCKWKSTGEEACEGCLEDTTWAGWATGWVHQSSCPAVLDLAAVTKPMGRSVWALVMLHHGPSTSRSQPSLAGQTAKAALETTLRGKVSITWAVRKQQSRWLTGC